MKIGIIGAMETEVSTIKEAMKADRVVTKAGMNFYEGMLQGTPAVVVQCGVGKVNAAMCVQILADLFHITHVLNTGVAGSLNADLDIGDILVSEKAIQHEVDVISTLYTVMVVIDELCIVNHGNRCITVGIKDLANYISAVIVVIF